MSRRPSFRGCCSGPHCAELKGRLRGQGYAARATVQVRRTSGRARRIRRRDIPADQTPTRET